MHFQGQSGIEAGEGKHRSQTAKRLTARVRQSDFGRYSRLVLALWLFRSLNTQIENALNKRQKNFVNALLAFRPFLFQHRGYSFQKLLGRVRLRKEGPHAELRGVRK